MTQKKYPVFEELSELTNQVRDNRTHVRFLLLTRIRQVEEAASLLENEIYYQLPASLDLEEQRAIAAQLTGRMLIVLANRYTKQDPNQKAAARIANMNEETIGNGHNFPSD